MYDAHNWKLLIKQLHNQPSLIHVLNRAQLLDDSFILARDRKINYEIPFKLATYLSKENDMIPWFTIVHIWKDLLNKYFYNSIGPQLKVAKHCLVGDLRKNCVGSAQRGFCVLID